MPTVLFHLARNLKISRFTIDVLIQRLEQLAPRCAGKYERVLRETQQAVENCDHLHNDLCDRFCKAKSSDRRSIASLTAAFEELNRRIKESISGCNVFEREDHNFITSS
jgi:hypothetical protein